MDLKINFKREKESTSDDSGGEQVSEIKAKPGNRRQLKQITTQQSVLPGVIKKEQLDDPMLKNIGYPTPGGGGGRFKMKKGETMVKDKSQSDTTNGLNVEEMKGFSSLDEIKECLPEFVKEGSIKDKNGLRPGDLEYDETTLYIP